MTDSPPSNTTRPLARLRSLASVALLLALALLSFALPAAAAPLPLPTIDETSASAVTVSSAVLIARIKPGLSPLAYRFQYGTTASYGEQTYPGEMTGSAKIDHTASADISALTPATTYHFRVVATNFNGTTVGPDQTFTTIDLPKVEGASASGVTQTTATLNAEIDPALSPTTYLFEYGTGPSYGSSTLQGAPLGEDSLFHLASADISALTPATTYHFRAVATNAAGTTQEVDQTFTTAAAPEEKKVEPPTCTKNAVLTDGACLCKHGYVKKHGKCVPKAKAKKHNHRGGKK